MAVYSRGFDVIYSLAPRTASSATAVTLKKKLGFVELMKEDIVDSNGNIIVDKKHVTFNQLIENSIICTEDFERAERVVTVRNPFDSLFSAWFKYKYVYTKLLVDKNSWLHKKPKLLNEMLYVSEHGFSDWIITFYSHMLDENPKHLYNKHLHNSTHVFKFEQLNEDINSFFASKGEDDFSIDKLNITEGKGGLSYRDYTNQEAKRIILDVFAPDFDKFGYDF